MADNAGVQMQKTLGLTGLTMNAMALIAPGAFLWLTFVAQGGAGNTAPSMWIGIFFAVLLCLATAVCYAELSKLYPGTGSSYYFAEQSFLNHQTAWPYARLAKFVVGWGSHLYYWIYPGVMCGVMGILCGYLVGTLWPSFMSASNPGPMFMMVCAIATAFGVAYIAYRGVTGSTAVNIAINVIQISTLLVFSVMALGFRANHPPGSVAYQFDSTSGDAYDYEFLTTSQTVNGTATDVIVRDDKGNPKPKLDAAGKPMPFHIDYPAHDDKGVFLSHPNAGSVIGIHNFGWVFVQATVAILILVGFESVTAMGGEAKNPKRNVPIAVITSLLVQGAFCYLFEYFAANYFLNSGYPMTSATGSAAPIGDMMVVVGNAILGPGNGRTFMLIEAFTVFLAIIGTTLSCMNTAARVTYAMGKDDEVPEHARELRDAAAGVGDERGDGGGAQRGDGVGGDGPADGQVVDELLSLLGRQPEPVGGLGGGEPVGQAEELGEAVPRVGPHAHRVGVGGGLPASGRAAGAGLAGGGVREPGAGPLGCHQLPRRDLLRLDRRLTPRAFRVLSVP